MNKEYSVYLWDIVEGTPGALTIDGQLVIDVTRDTDDGCWDNDVEKWKHFVESLGEEGPHKYLNFLGIKGSNFEADMGGYTIIASLDYHITKEVEILFDEVQIIYNGNTKMKVGRMKGSVDVEYFHNKNGGLQKDYANGVQLFFTPLGFVDDSIERGVEAIKIKI